jgi:hypothetical protein
MNSSGAVEVARKPDVGHSVYMYPFPPSDDLRFLVGETIGQIALDPWSLQFRFADGGQITVEHIRMTVKNQLAKHSIYTNS